MALMDNWDAGDSDSMVANLETANNATGALQDQADVYAESWDAASKQLKATIEDIWDSLLNDDFFIDFTQMITGLIEGIGKVVDAMGGMHGILMTIGVVATRVFEKQIATGLTNMVNNIKMISPNQRALVQAQKQEAVGLATALATNKTGSVSYATQAEGLAMKQELSIQDQLIAKEKLLTQEQQSAYKIRLDSLRISQQELMVLGEKIDKNKKLINQNKRTVRLEAREEAGKQIDQDKNLQALHSSKLSQKAQEERIAAATNFVKTDQNTQKHIELRGNYLANKQGISLEQAIAQAEQEEIEKYKNQINTSFAQLRQQREAEIEKRTALAMGEGSTFQQVSKLGTQQGNLLGMSEVLQSNTKGLQTNTKTEINNLQKMNADPNTSDTQRQKNLEKINSLLSETKTKNIELLESFNKLDIPDDLKAELERIINKLKEVDTNADNADKALEDIGVLMNEASGLVTTSSDQTEEQYKEVDPTKKYNNTYNAHSQDSQDALLFATNSKIIQDNVDKTNQSLMNIQGMKNWATNLTRTSSILMSFGMTLSSVKGLVDVFNNPDASGWDKFVAILTTGGMVLGSVAGIINTATVAMQTNTESIYGNIVATIAQYAVKFWYVAAVMAVVAAIWLVIRAQEEEATAAEKAAEAQQLATDTLKKATAAATEAKNAYDELKSTLDSYQNQEDKLRGLVKGTQDWKEAVFELNSQVYKLLEEYPDLINYLDRTEEGVLRLKDGAQEFLMGEAEKRINKTANIVLESQNDLLDAQINTGKIELVEKFLVSFEDKKIKAEFDDLNIDQIDSIYDVLNSINDFSKLTLDEQNAIKNVLSNAGIKVTDNDIAELVRSGNLPNIYSNLNSIANKYLQKQESKEQRIDTLSDQYEITKEQATDAYTAAELYSGMLTVDNMRQNNTNVTADAKGNTISRALDAWSEALGFEVKVEDGVFKKRDEKSGQFKEYEFTDAEYKQFENYLKLQYEETMAYYIGQGKSAIEAMETIQQNNSGLFGTQMVNINPDDKAQAAARADQAKQTGWDEKYAGGYRPDQMGNYIIAKYDTLKKDDTEKEDSVDINKLIEQLYTEDDWKGQFVHNTKSYEYDKNGKQISDAEIQSRIFAQLNSIQDIVNTITSETGNSNLANQIKNALLAYVGTEGAEGIFSSFASYDWSKGYSGDVRDVFGKNKIANADDQLGQEEQYKQNFKNEKTKIKEYTEDDIWKNEAEEVGLTTKAFKDKTQALQANNSKLKDNEGLARECAKATQNMTKLVTQGQKKWLEYADGLDKNKVTLEEFKTNATNLANELNNVFGTDLFTADFIDENYTKIQGAMKGQINELNWLYEEITKNKFKNLIIGIEGLDDTEKTNLINSVNNWINSAEFENIKVGSEVDLSDLPAELQKLITMGKITADQLNEMFGGAFDFELVPYTFSSSDSKVSESNGKYQIFNPDDPENPIEVPVENAIQNKSQGTVTVYLPKGKKVASLSSVSGALAKTWNNSKGGGGGGGGKKAIPRREKVKRSDPKRKRTEVDPYKEIEDQLKTQNRELDKIKSSEDALYGLNKIKAMDKKIAKQKDIIALEKDYLKTIEKTRNDDLWELTRELGEQGYSIELDASGNMTNYKEVFSAVVDKYNADIKAIEDAQQVINDEKYTQEKTGADSTAQQDFDWEERQEKLDEERDKIEKNYEEIIELFGLYDESNDKFWEKQAEKREAELEAFQAELDKINYTLEVKLEINDRELSIIDHYIGLIENKTLKAAEAFELMALKTEPLLANAEALTQNIENLKAKLDTLDPASDEYGLTIQEILDKTDQLIEAREAWAELDEQALEYYSEAWDKEIEPITRIQDIMSASVDTLGQYNDLLNLIGQSKNYSKIGQILQGQYDGASNTYAVAKGLYEVAQNEYDAILARWEQEGDTLEGYEREMLAEKLQVAAENVNETKEAMLSSLQELGELANSILENSLAKLREQLEEDLFGGFSAENYLDQLDKLSKKQEEYLTTTNKMYETNKLIRQAQIDMDKTDNQRAKQQYDDYVKYIEQLQQSSKLSSYELSIAQARYEVLQAQIALEEAQDAKSQVRLTRDSEGNYGYVYTADENKIADAEGALADAENALYNIGLQGAQDYQSKMVENYNSYIEELSELEEKRRTGEIKSEEEYEKEQQRIIEHYRTQNQTFLEQYYIALDLLESESVTGSADYNLMRIDQLGDFDEATNEYLADVNRVWDDYETNTQEVADQTSRQVIKQETEDIRDATSQAADAILKPGGLLDGLNQEMRLVRETTSLYALNHAERLKIIGDLEEQIRLVGELDKLEGKKLADADVADWSLELADLIEQGADSDKIQHAIEQHFAKANNAGISYDYQSLQQQYLANGGKESDALYKAYDMLRNYKLYNVMDIGNYLAQLASEGYSRNSDLVQQFAEYRFNKLKAQGLSEYNASIDVTKMLNGLWPNDPIKASSKFNTGGYTGVWGPDGKFAILHEKELVLNASDTENILSAVGIVRQLTQSLELAAAAQALGQSSLQALTVGNTAFGNTLQQDVHITADFPNVTDHNEIEIAINNLINAASQYAN